MEDYQKEALQRVSKHLGKQIESLYLRSEDESEDGNKMLDFEQEVYREMKSVIDARLN